MKSSPCAQEGTLAHNFVHKNCAEAYDGCEPCSRASGCLNFGREDFLHINQRLTIGKGYSSQIYPQKLWATTCIWRTRGAVGKIETRRRSASCRVFTHGKISYKNQSTWRVGPALRTLLSTESVQNCTCRKAGNTLHCATTLTHCLSLIFRSSSCSPSSKPPAGPSGCC